MEIIAFDSHKRICRRFSCHIDDAEMTLANRPMEIQRNLKKEHKNGVSKKKKYA